MTSALEARIENQYRSNGERKIADLLDQYGIKYQYEPDIYLKSGRKTYIWHPDFYLPEYRVVVEYLGLHGNGSYDQTTLRKKRVYYRNQYHFIPVYPETLRKDYQSYIFKSIQTYLDARSRDFYQKTQRQR